MMLSTKDQTRVAMRRSAQQAGTAVLSRRSRSLTVALEGRFNAGAIEALIETHVCSSSGLARYIEKCWHERRAWYPDEHPILALHNAVFFAEAGIRQAKKQLRGSRLRSW